MTAPDTQKGITTNDTLATRTAAPADVTQAAAVLEHALAEAEKRGALSASNAAGNPSYSSCTGKVAEVATRIRPDQIATGYWITYEELEAIKADARADEVGKVVEWLRAEFQARRHGGSGDYNPSDDMYDVIADALASGQWKETR